jgi:phosphomannomutase
MASVSGIRGIVGASLTPQLAVDAGCAFATHVGGGRIVIARDSRPSGTMVASAVTAGLLAGGCDVVDLGIVTTPGAALMVRELGAAGGIVVTASHNPAPWNGMKFLTADGAAPPRSVAEQILKNFQSRSFSLAAAERVGRLSTDSSTAERHVNRVLSIVAPPRIRTRNFHVVLDSVCGAGGPSARMLLEALGCRIEHLHAEPSGRFPHAPEPLAENLTELAETTRRVGAAVGFAQDPDADRLALIDEHGRYVGEEYTLALTARQVLTQRRGPAVANLSTSRMLDDIAASFGADCPVHRSAVGEANVVELMRATGAVIGGEGNGGVIDPRVVYVRDSLTAMALVLQLMSERGAPLSRLVDELARWRMIKQKFECPPERISRILAAIRRQFAREQLIDIDGVRIDWPEGWVHVRGSNTEPIIRIIAEAADETAAQALIERVRPAIATASRNSGHQ